MRKYVNVGSRVLLCIVYLFGKSSYHLQNIIKGNSRSKIREKSNSKLVEKTQILKMGYFGFHPL